MSEMLYQHRPETSLDDQYAALPLELMEDFSLWTAELEESIVEFASEEVKQISDYEQIEPLSLQEQYDLPFEPEQTIRGIGSIGLTMVMMPDAFQREMQKETLDAMADVKHEEKQETAGSFAQDKAEYQDYVAQATSIVYNLRYGDESGLGALPTEFQDALSVRMSQRLRELDDGSMNDGEFGLEVKKMISVACTGLAKANDISLR